MEAAPNARSTPVCLARQRGFSSVLAFDVDDRAANVTTFGRRSRLADLTTEEPFLLDLCNGYSPFHATFRGPLAGPAHQA
jgi:hypothetical protein